MLFSPNPLLTSLEEFENIQNNNIASCPIWLRNIFSYIKRGLQAKGIWKQDPETNIWVEEGYESWIEKAPQVYSPPLGNP